MNYNTEDMDEDELRRYHQYYGNGDILTPVERMLLGVFG